MRRFVAGVATSVALAGGMAGCGGKEAPPATAEVSAERIDSAVEQFDALTDFWANHRTLSGEETPTLDVINKDEVFECTNNGIRITSGNLATSYCDEKNTITLPAAAIQEQDKTTVGSLATAFILSYEVGNWAQMHALDTLTQPGDTAIDRNWRAFCLGGTAMAFDGKHNQNDIQNSAVQITELSELDPAAFGTPEQVSKAFLAGANATIDKNGRPVAGKAPCVDIRALVA